MTADSKLIPLTEACVLIGWDYQKLRSCVMRGECEGARLYGRWVVNEASALRLREQAAKAEPAK